MQGRQQSITAASRRPCGLGLHGRFNITTADVTSSGNGSDDEDSSEETTYPTVFPGWDISVAKKEYAPSTSKELPFSLDVLFGVCSFCFLALGLCFFYYFFLFPFST